MYVNAEAVLQLLTDINELWNREGFGTDWQESDALKARLESAIRQLKGEEQ